MAVMVIWSTKQQARETGMSLEAIAVLLVVSESFYESNDGKKKKVPWGVKKITRMWAGMVCPGRARGRGGC